MLANEGISTLRPHSALQGHTPLEAAKKALPNDHPTLSHKPGNNWGVASRQYRWGEPLTCLVCIDVREAKETQQALIGGSNLDTCPPGSGVTATTQSKERCAKTKPQVFSWNNACANLTLVAAGHASLCRR